MTASNQPISFKNYEYVRNALLERREIAFLDVREEGPHAEEHPLFAQTSRSLESSLTLMQNSLGVMCQL